MNYGRLLAQSWQILRRHRFLWLFGFFISLGGLANHILRSLFIDQLLAVLRDPSLIQSAAIGIEKVISVLAIGTALIFFISIAYWLTAAIAQGAIIGTVEELERGDRVSASQAIRLGVGLLGRFIALDTLVYFPIFVLLLILLLVILVLLLGVLFIVYRAASMELIGGFLLIGLAGLTPLLLLLIPFSLLTSIFRTLAFRDTAVRRSNVRDTIHYTGYIIRRRFGSLLIIWGLVWGIQFLTDGLLTFVILPLSWIFQNLGITGYWEGWLAGLVSVGPLAILHTFTTVAWTIAYQKLVE